MKFGKELLNSVNQANPEWGPFWMNYKVLKKRIKAVVKSRPKTANTAENVQDLTQCREEIEFFSELRNQLRKLTCFYVSEEKRYMFRFHQLQAVLTDMKKKNEVDPMDAKRLMLAFVHFYKECIQLENYAVMNYQGFSKILKKHDKMTGHNTRTKYMRKMVNQSPFANYPQLINMLESTERMFSEIPVGDSVMQTAMHMATMMGQSAPRSKSD
jgi:SPX domain protein involved in polyphosphate accumulation